MKRISTYFVLVATLLLMHMEGARSMINVVPRPNYVKETSGVFTFRQGMQVYSPGHSGAAALLERKLSTAAGIRLRHGTNKQSAITMEIDTSAIQSPEGYQLSVTPHHILLQASTETGLYYGVQTLLQLLPPQIESPCYTKARWQAPCVQIKDAPAFRYRGIMLDVCRHFLPAERIKKILDVMAMYKMNRFHWHLTDDQGWRIQIKRYPKLTQIGSTRIGDDGKPYGGYYTQDQIREIVKYAAARHITVIPEIEMPGHALAALSAYPQYSNTGGPFKPRTVWGVEENVYNPANDSVYTFLSNILDEVCTLFPSQYIHIGGDECPKNRWKESPQCQLLMKKEGLKNEEELQSYFVKRMEKIVAKKGRKIIGWDEILEGGIAPSATIMSWRGEQGGIDAANAGHDVIMTPGSVLYLDHYQGSPLCEPVKIGGLTTLQQMYAYNPIPKAISPAMKHHVLGLQGNLWSEYLYTPDEFEYQLFPRALAVAETGWTQPENKNTDDFIRRMDDQQIRLDEHHIHYYIPMPEGNLNYMEFTDSLRLPFTTNRPVRVVYTLDGTTPTGESKTYTTPILITKTTTLKLRTILPQGKMSAVRTIHLTKTSSMQGIATLPNTQAGIRLRYTGQGYYTRTSQLTTVKQWKDTIVSNPNQFFNLVPTYTDGKSYPGEPRGAAILTGYLHITDPGEYRLHSNADVLWINGKKLIDNEGQIKKFVRTDIAVPFTNGYYPVKMIILNNILGGVPASWADFHITLAKWDTTNEDQELKIGPVVYK
ncbi:family 20 glycosylhydrolase [Microbacter margulisiae]|uniref:beta-N-acetylhexosaminidase n=1 Tax=Microbacter margulisiae TaxID=1350067 RepID=A0A7W5DTC8_9PORP|nr:family 20 glycosylhydrolase [Microbacter margulisiae]MBB3188707.1 hexosaminidase [Microbacter margulisiae]